MTTKLALAFVLATSSIATADVMVMDNNKTVEVDCAKDKNVSLMGNNATATLKGTCDKVALQGNSNKVTGSATTVQITGNKNTATLTTVDAIQVTGNENTVTYKGPAAAKETKVSNPGNKNSITKAK